jgi:hypothetical protein
VELEEYAWLVDLKATDREQRARRAHQEDMVDFLKALAQMLGGGKKGGGRAR